MKIAVVGPGAIGTLFAAHLKLGGFDPILIDHVAERARRISSRPLLVWSQNNSLEATVECTSEVSVAKDADYVIVAVKAYNTAEVAKALASHATSSQVVSLQNGLGNLEILERYFESNQILAASTGEASTLVGPGEVFHAASGITKIAPLAPEGRRPSIELVKVFQKAGIGSVFSDNAQGVIWEKLVVNSSINPITAITRMRNGEIVRNAGLKALASQVALETYEVALKEGIALGFQDPGAVVLAAASTTFDNKSSMLQDIERGRRTEVDFINGAIYRLAASSGVPAPLNGTLYAIVKSIEERIAGSPEGLLQAVAPR